MEETNLYNKIKELEDENTLLKEKLKNYTAPKRSKTFYENHKEDVLQKNKEYKEKTNYYAKNKPLPTIDETFILYCIKLHLFQTPITFQEYDKNSTTTNSYLIIPDNVKSVPLLEYPVFLK
jgi:hypothetical protein